MNRQLTTYKMLLPVQTNPATSIYSLRAIGFVPADTLPYLSSILHVQKIRYVDLFSEPLHYGKAKVTSFHFSGEKILMKKYGEV
jgi:hypothetical protein